MRYREIISEGKWWEDTPTITLYHGTSTAHLDDIRTNGLRPPHDELETYAEDILAHYIPREQWTEELLDQVYEKCLRIRYHTRDQEKREHLFFCTDPESPEGYARSYAAHGGEIAYTIWQTVNLWLQRDKLDDMSWAEFMKNPVVAPRYAAEKPIVVEVEIPREWAIFHTEIDHMKRRLARQWESGQGGYRKRFRSFEEMLDDVLDRSEVRVSEAIPPHMIRSIREVEPEKLDERAFHGTNRAFTAFRFRKFDTHPSTIGVWFASKREIAAGFAQDRVVEAELRIQQPAEFDRYEDFLAAFREAGSDGRKLRRKLIRQGHDGVKIVNSTTDGLPLRTDWVAFYPHQIEIVKSHKLNEKFSDLHVRSGWTQLGSGPVYNTIRLWENPGRDEFEGAIRQCFAMAGEPNLRGFAHAGKVYVWNADLCTHHGVLAELGFIKDTFEKFDYSNPEFCFFMVWANHWENPGDPISISYNGVGNNLEVLKATSARRWRKVTYRNGGPFMG